jgi:putative transposase
MIRAYRTALDPTTEQRRALARHAGAARWAYNWALARWREQYAEHKAGERERGPSWMSLHKELTPLKRTEFPWLYEVSAYAVREAFADLGSAYQHFWRRLKKQAGGDHGECKPDRAGRCQLGEPQFRSRTDPSGRGFRVAECKALDCHTNMVKVPGVGWVKLAEHGYVPVGANYRGLSCREVAGRWYISVVVDDGQAEVAVPGPRAGEAVGVEVGVRVLAQTSDGKAFGAVRDLDGLAKAERRRKLWERRMARRHKKGVSRREQSRGWQEAARAVAKLHARCADVRRDKLPQTTTRIVRAARGATIVMRDMQVSKMLGRAGKTGADARARNAIAPMVAKVGMYELRRQVEYKQGWAGSAFVAVPSETPTTRTCSACGVVRETDPGYPSWRCGACGVSHDRELNSARNLKALAGGNPGETGGRAVRRKTPQGAQRPKEPDQSASEVSTTPTTTPDGEGAVSAALATLGLGNRTAGEQSPAGTGGGNADPTGGAASAPSTSTHRSIEQRGDAPGAPEGDQPLASRQDGPGRGRSRTGVEPGDIVGGSP